MKQWPAVSGINCWARIVIVIIDKNTYCDRQAAKQECEVERFYFLNTGTCAVYSAKVSGTDKLKLIQPGSH